MKKILLISLLLVASMIASVNIDTTYSTFGAITKKIAGSLVNVKVLGSNKYDPHFIVPKPSLISKLRRADLLIINGGGLEIGWLPPLIRNANNAKIQNGAQGFLDISHFVKMIDKPTSVSRAFGDIHAQGNPHYSIDPHLVLTIAKAIADKLSDIDQENAKKYENNLKIFEKEWHIYLLDFDKKMQKCKFTKVVQYHELYNYFLERYKIKSIANIETLPGIAPSSKHTINLINSMKKHKIKKILQDVYHEKKTAKFIAAKTGAKVSIIPHDVGSVDGSETLEKFYNMIANRLCN